MKVHAAFSARVAVSIISSAFWAASSMAASAERPIRLDDLNSLENIGLPNDWSIARDGALAFQIDRAPNTRKTWNREGFDVWVVLPSQRQPVNLTQGQTDGSDWRQPLWSPDGQRLVMQSTRPSRQRSLWIWERSTGEFRLLAKEVLPRLEALYEWIDDEHILATTLPAGMTAQGIEDDTGPVTAAKAGWARYAAGQFSGSLLQTALPDASESAPWLMREIVLIDVKTGATRKVMNAYRAAQHDFYPSTLSPDGRFIAIALHAPPVGHTYHDLGGSMKVEIRRTDGNEIRWNRPLPEDVLPQTAFRWSPDGRQVAFFAYGHSREHPPKLFRVNAQDGVVEEQDLGEIIVQHMRDGQWDYARLEWTEKGDIVCQAGRGEAALEKYSRRDWWLVPRTAAPRLLTAQMKTVPDLGRYSVRGPLVAVADGYLWRLNAERVVLEPVVSPSPGRSIMSIAWPHDPLRRLIRASKSRRYFITREERLVDSALVVQLNAQANEENRYAVVDLTKGSLSVLAAPGPEARLVRLDPQFKSAFWLIENAVLPGDRADGSTLWRSQIDSDPKAHSPVRIVDLNVWRAKIMPASGRSIDYSSLDGLASTGWLQLPIGYQKGRRYPTIVNVYPGQRPTGPRGSKIDHAELAAANGFASLSPQMGSGKGKMYGMSTRDVYFEIVDGVLPAVDRAIALGIADPDRLFVEGTSMGGFAALALLQQTKRFRAAIARAGIYNWSSMWGTFAAAGRYGENLRALGIGFAGENIQQRPAVETPWSDMSLYVRNSPITYVERVRTPVLLVHGDQDRNVPMTQSEEMFSALQHLKARAGFIRYWGEDHAIDNPANVRDLWQRRLAWFDEFGDIARDEHGRMIFDGERVKSRGGEPALAPQAYGSFEFFQPGGKIQ